MPTGRQGIGLRPAGGDSPLRGAIYSVAALHTATEHRRLIQMICAPNGRLPAGLAGPVTSVALLHTAGRLT